MDNQISIVYSFSFKDKAPKEFGILLDKETLSLIPKEPPAVPPWAELSRNRCKDCSLDERTFRYCPVAYNLVAIAEQFKDCFAYEPAGVTVTTEERTYSKETIIQEGLGSLLGIIMATSGCPVMEYFKPMARFHLPFATLTETIFRISSVYLISQYFLKQEARLPVLDLERINDIYLKVGELNRDFSQRLAEAAKKDASINALVNLDCFASMIPLATGETFAELKRYFAAYLK